eukprot:6010234-Pyramimonas_sp.AAC.1
MRTTGVDEGAGGIEGMHEFRIDLRRSRRAHDANWNAQTLASSNSMQCESLKQNTTSMEAPSPINADVYMCGYVRLGVVPVVGALAGNRASMHS